MRYYRVRAPDAALVVEAGAQRYNLTTVKPEVTTFRDLASVAAVFETNVDDVASRLVDAAEPLTGAGELDLVTPVTPDEVWAAGVTYAISEEAREAESGLPDLYLDVYDAERPELFFKATANRVVGPGDAVGVRGDSDWNVPEPELGIVLYRGNTVGYTIGNDVSSRDIEGANPLYLPQAKVYDRCCAIGPAIASPEAVGDPHDLTMSMTIEREGAVVFDGESSTTEMVRTCGELVEAYTRHNAIPEVGVLLTGTSLVPPDEFTLMPRDVVTIEIESIGQLTTPVVAV